MENEVKKEDAAFFSVKHSCTIGGGQFRPSICYPIPNSLAKVIGEMADQGMARLYAQEVRFVSGVARPMAGPVQETVMTTNAVVKDPVRTSNNRRGATSAAKAPADKSKDKPKDTQEDES
jgi:hypothetical protein